MADTATMNYESLYESACLEIDGLSDEYEELSWAHDKLQVEHKNLKTEYLELAADYAFNLQEESATSESQSVLLDSLVDSVKEARDQAKFLAQTLLAISTYRGSDPTIPTVMALAAINDWVRDDEVESEQD